MDGTENQAFVTLTTNDVYAVGAIVWAHSLRRQKTTRKIVAIVTPGVAADMRRHLQEVCDDLLMVDVLDSQDEAHLALMKRPELGVTLTKIHAWSLTQFSKCVFMDADTLVVDNIDDLFERDELSATPDIGWPDCFNSGVFVFKPSEETFQGLVRMAETEGSFDGGDQGLLNSYFSTWSMSPPTHRLPFVYNMAANVTYSYLPAFKKFGQDVKVCHFLGALKPWHHTFDDFSGKVQPIGNNYHVTSFLQLWWNIYRTELFPHLSHQQQEMVHSQPAAAPVIAPGIPVGTIEHRTAFESGDIDVTGRDSFDNILQHLNKSVSDVDAIVR